MSIAARCEKLPYVVKSSARKQTISDMESKIQDEQPISHAVIILHGLCGSALEMGSIPRTLRKNGCAVIELLIAGYSAAQIDTAASPNWEDWCAVVESEIIRLKVHF